MQELLLDALIDSAKMIPILLIVYLVVEYLEYRMGDQFSGQVTKGGKIGVAVGSVLGCVPQCGFSVVATTLYLRRMITVGTLMAVYLATSDEAIPIILSNPGQAGILLPLILVKIVIALAAGYLIDFFAGKRRLHPKESPFPLQREHHRSMECEYGCDHHHRGGVGTFLINPIKRTINVFFFVLAVSVLLNLLIYWIGEETLKQFLLTGSILQPVLVGLIGLIPNCAASILITEMLLSGSISFGAAIAGLSTAAGFGAIVLFKENRGNLKENLIIVGMLYGIGVAAGMLIQLFPIA